MGAGTMKQLIIELTRGGCKIEVLAHDPPAITFRTPAGARCAIRGNHPHYELAGLIDTSPSNPMRGQFATMSEAVRAACRA